MAKVPEGVLSSVCSEAGALEVVLGRSAQPQNFWDFLVPEILRWHIKISLADIYIYILAPKANNVPLKQSGCWSRIGSLFKGFGEASAGRVLVLHATVDSLGPCVC